MRLDPVTFDDLRKAVHDLCGIVIAADKHYLVVSRLEPVLIRNGLTSYEALLQGLKRPDSLPLQEQVIDAITTKETSFNRDGHPFEELRRSILPELARRLLEGRVATTLFNPRSRIWCAAVATGQEPYSVAMAVADSLACQPGLALTGENFPILATDISEACADDRPGRSIHHVRDRPGHLPRAADEVLPPSPGRLGRRRLTPTWDRVPAAQPHPASPQPGDVRPHPVPEPHDLPRRGFTPPPVSKPSSSASTPVEFS